MKIDKIYLIPILIILIFGVVFVFDELNKDIEITSERLNESIDKGIEFLYENQLDYGEFKTYACKDKRMENCYFDSSVFLTTFVLYSIRNLEDEKIKIMTNKSLDFLLNEQEEGGIWEYFTNLNEQSLPFDLDDMAVISFTLKSNNISFDDNLKLFENNRNSEGLFYTWLNMSEKENDVDCVVNTNVLLYLKKNDLAVCNKINSAIINDESCAIWYSDKYIFYYVVSRAYENNITCFNKSSTKIINNILEEFNEKDGSFGSDLHTAIAIIVLDNFDYNGREFDLAVKYLLRKQKNDGSWERSVLYSSDYLSHYYGSEEFTTAIVIEALYKYKNIRNL